MNQIYNQGVLLRALESKQENVAIWGAYQLLLAEPEQIRKILPQFLQSPYVDIVEVGVQKVAELKAEELITLVLKIFRESEGQLKYTTSITLSKFSNHISQKLLGNWLQTLIASEHVTRVELEAASLSTLEIDKEKNFKNLSTQLPGIYHDGIKSSIILAALIKFIGTRAELDETMKHYFALRDLYPDPELTFQLVDHFGNPEIIEWIVQKIAHGYSISSIYEQSFGLLDITITLKDRRRWEEIETAFSTYERLYSYKIKDSKSFLAGLVEWTQSIILADPTTDTASLLWLLESFSRYHEEFSQTTPKLMEMEANFILSIPLSIALENSFQDWISDPSRYSTQIANYYHSSILTTKHREQLLALFFPQEMDWQGEETVITADGTSLTDNWNQNEIFWKFFRKELLGFDIPWPNIFPNPDCSLRLLSGLFLIYYTNFSYFITKKDKVSIDYALLLFQLWPDKKTIVLVIDNFEYLYQHHTDGLFQTIEYVPDPAYVSPLISNYQEGEYEIVKLVFQICEIFDLEQPESIQKDLKYLQEESNYSRSIQQRIRLHCDICGHSFQYFVDRIYVDEGAILRMNRLLPKSVWVSQKFNCKRCSAALPFQLSDEQLEELTLQSRIDRRLKNLPQSQGVAFGQRIFLIDFPHFKSRIYNPIEFKELVQRYESNSQANQADLIQLWIKEARLNMAMLLWQECHEVLGKIEQLADYEIEWVFMKGQVEFKLQHFVQARRYFDWIVQHHQNENSNSSFGVWVEQAKYFLKNMDSEQAKRSRLKMVTGKK